MKYQVVAAALVTTVLAAENPYSTYPKVAKTATINGFADPIYGQLPSCAQPCVKKDTGNTPCPYWDTGCLCVMPQWDGPVAECIASACKGNEVKVATDLAVSICKSAGVYPPYWIIPSAASSALNAAAAQVEATTTSEEETSAPTTVPSSTTQAESVKQTPTETTANVESTDAPVTAIASSGIPEESQHETVQSNSQSASIVPSESNAQYSAVESSAPASSETIATSSAETSSSESVSASASKSGSPEVSTLENHGNNNLPTLAISAGGVFVALAMII